MSVGGRTPRTDLGAGKIPGFKGQGETRELERVHKVTWARASRVNRMLGLESISRRE